MSAAREAGWPVYGAGFVEQLRGRSRESDAHVALARDRGEQAFEESRAWMDEQPDVER